MLQHGGACCWRPSPAPHVPRCGVFITGTCTLLRIKINLTGSRCGRRQHVFGTIEVTGTLNSFLALVSHCKGTRRSRCPRQDKLYFSMQHILFLYALSIAQYVINCPAVCGTQACFLVQPTTSCNASEVKYGCRSPQGSVYLESLRLRGPCYKTSLMTPLPQSLLSRQRRSC